MWTWPSRVKAFRDLIRNELVTQESTKPDAQVFGTVALIYDHHARLVPERLAELQHKYFAAIMSTVHVHLDHNNCLEVVLVKGSACLKYCVRARHVHGGAGSALPLRPAATICDIFRGTIPWVFDNLPSRVSA